jgi:hypothetical protein
MAVPRWTMIRVPRPTSPTDDAPWRVIDDNLHNLKRFLESSINNGSIVNDDTKEIVGDVEGTIGSDGDTVVVALQEKALAAPSAGDNGKAITYSSAGAGSFAYTTLYSSPLTTRGDLLTRDASAHVRLGIGAANRILKSDGTDPSWATLTAMLDAVFGSTRGMILRREASAWAAYALGANGKVLSSDGTDALWSDPPAGAAHDLLSATHSDTLADNVEAGDIIIGNATPKWARLAKDSDGKILTLVSGLPAWADAAGGSAHNLLSATHTDTSAASVVRGDIIVGNSTPAWARVAKGSNDTILRSDGTDPSWTDPKRFFYHLGYAPYAAMVVGGTSNEKDCGAVRLWTGSGTVSDPGDAEKFCQLVTGTTTASIGFRTNTGTAEIQARHYPHLRCDLKLTDNVDGCTWIGFSNQATMPNTADPGQQTAAFRARNGTDTNWQCVTRDSGGTVNTQDSNVAIDTNWHEFEVYTPDGGTTWKFVIDGVEVKSITSNVPTTSQVMTAFAPWMNPISSTTRTFQITHASVVNNKKTNNF